MKPRRPSPPRPFTLQRRIFASNLSIPSALSLLEPALAGHISLGCAFISETAERSLRISSPDFKGDIRLSLQADEPASLRVGRIARPSALIVDFRKADQDAADAILAILGGELRAHRQPRPRSEIMGHSVPGYQKNVGHYLVWSAKMPSTEDHLITNTAIDAGLGCQFDGFDLIPSAMHALDFERMLRIDADNPLFEGPNEMPELGKAHFRKNLRGAQAIRILHRDSKLVLDQTIDTQPDTQGRILRLHYCWLTKQERYLIGWISELESKLKFK
jgi:hypothetical protein